MHLNTAAFIATIGVLSLSRRTRLGSGCPRMNWQASYLAPKRSTSSRGSTHNWTNEPEGKFVASTDDGKYCVSIDWSRYSENWCYFVYRTPGGGYFMTETDNSAAKKRKIELTK